MQKHSRVKITNNSTNCFQGYSLAALVIRPMVHMSLVVRKPVFCICENKDADQLRGNREADQRLCFRYTDSTIPLLPIFQAFSHLVWLCSLVCVGPGRKLRRPVFSQRGSYDIDHAEQILPLLGTANVI